MDEVAGKSSSGLHDSPKGPAASFSRLAAASAKRVCVWAPNEVGSAESHMKRIPLHPLQSTVFKA